MMEKHNFYLKKNKSKAIFSGFTLMESLLALVVLSVICMLFSASIKNATVVTTQLKSEREKEWHIFVIQLENELKNCYYKKTEASKIILINRKNDKHVWIEHKLGKIIKVENGGYQPLLTEVKQAEFTEENSVVMLKAKFEDGMIMSAKWVITVEQEDEK